MSGSCEMKLINALSCRLKQSKRACRLDEPIKQQPRSDQYKDASRSPWKPELIC